MKSLPQPEPNDVRWYQFSLRTLFVVFTVVGVPLGWYCQFIYPLNARREELHQIDATFESLEAKCPASMTQRQWEVAMEWLPTLMGNSVVMQPDLNLRDLRRFRTELQGKAEGNVDLRTIHWIWDQIGGLTDAGKRYQRWRQPMLDEIDAVGELGPFPKHSPET